MNVCFNNVRSEVATYSVSTELKDIIRDAERGAIAGLIATTITAGGIIAIGGCIPGTAVIGIGSGITGIEIPKEKIVKVSAVTSAIVIGGA